MSGQTISRYRIAEKGATNLREGSAIVGD